MRLCAIEREAYVWSLFSPDATNHPYKISVSRSFVAKDTSLFERYVVLLCKYVITFLKILVTLT